jgi:hypothetical protein
MSTYRSSTTALNASVAGAYDLFEGQYDALLAGMCSTNVVDLAHTLERTPSAVDASSWSRVEAALPSWAEHLPAASVGTMAAARAGDIALPTALHQIAFDLASMERRALATASVSALTDLGYSVQTAEGQQTSAVEARRGHETFLVVVGDQGRIETDHVGLADDSCNDRQRDFVEAMGRRGVMFDENVTVQHHDPRGGSPVANAARAGGTSLAEGAVIDGDSRPSAFTTTLYQTKATSSTRVAEGGQR